jgi:Uma2 family endonuclease
MVHNGIIRENFMSFAYQEHYSIKDYEQWEGNWELISGAPYAMTPSPGISHQRTGKKIALQLDPQLTGCPECELMYELDWYCSDDTVVRPDLLIACNIKGEKLTSTPECIIEIISPCNAKRDEIIKMKLYADEGVKIYILVYPETKKAATYQLKNGTYQKAYEYQKETFSFKVKDCQLKLDFSKIWS